MISLLVSTQYHVESVTDRPTDVQISWHNSIAIANFRK